MFDLDENLLRLSIFLGVLVLCAIIETLLPRKQRTQGRSQRWITNISLIIVDSITVRLMGQITALSAAALAIDNGWGLFNLVELPILLEIILAIILLDLAVYGQHVASHHVPVLWRFHRVHHADRDIDVTTGTRFHPIEIVFSMLFKCLVILLLGPALVAVFIFEVILNASAMFNHANIKLSFTLDKIIRTVVVTPDMHRVHHSIIPKETNSNYGFFMSVWDRLFKTYQSQPVEGHDNMTIGLKEYQDRKPSSISWCIKLPFMP